MRSKRGLFAGLIGGFAAGAVLFSAVGAWAVDTHEGKPFDGVLNGNSEASLGATGILVAGQGNIHANHIGNGTYTLAAEQDYPRHTEESDPDAQQCAFVEDGPNGDGSPGIVITAANGDTINGYINDNRSVVCAPDAQGPGGAEEGDVYLSTLYVEIDGGTGRFADATGYFFSRGESTISSPPSMMGSESTDEAVLLGDIDY